MTTDERGQVTFTGFLRDYDLTLDDETRSFTLGNSGKAALPVAL
jgi:hypothetical protein